MSMREGEIENIIYELIAKELEGPISIEEKDLILRWRKAKKSNEQEYHEVRDLWTLSAAPKEKLSLNTDLAWTQMKLKISEEKPVIKISRSRSRVSYPWFRIAAAVTVLIAASWLISTFIDASRSDDFTEWEVQYTAETEIIETQLEDGSTIDLNKGTKLYVADDFGKKERKIQLEGEAYFDIEPDQEKPFVINAIEAEITVLGTSFNVFAYPDSSSIRIEVSEGLVSVALLEEKYVLSEGMSLEYDRLSNEVIESTASGDERFWKNRILEFRRSPIEEVIETLEKNYDHQIVLMNPDIANCELTVGFENEDLETILEILAATLDLTVNEQDNEWLIDGEGCPEN